MHPKASLYGVLIGVAVAAVAAGSASAQEVDLSVGGATATATTEAGAVAVNVTVAGHKATVRVGDVDVRTGGTTTPAVSTGRPSGNAVDAAVSNEKTRVAASVGCIAGAASALGQNVAATVGSCPNRKVVPAAHVHATSGSTTADVVVNCVVLAASGAIAGTATAGACPGGGGAPVALGGSAASGNTGAGAAVGCITAAAAGAVETLTATLGACHDPASGESGAGAGGAGEVGGQNDGQNDALTDSAGGSGVAGATTPLGVADGVASPGEGSLPFTGLALWTVVALGVLITLGGVLLRRHTPLG